MRHVRRVGWIVVALALAGAAAYGAGQANARTATGTVVAVPVASRTIFVESELDGQPWIMGAEVTDQTRFGGKAKDLEDIKPGDKVTIRWVREENRPTARSVAVR